MTENRLDDDELIKQWRQGDEKAFEDLYNRWRRPLYSYLNKMVPGQSSLVDDLYQKTWIKIINKVPKYKEQSKFASWLFRIAHNTAIDYFRRESKMNSVELNEEITGAEKAPWEDEEKELLHRKLEECIQYLSDEQREVVLLRQKGISFKEIAEIQGDGLNTVLGRMHYAVKKLRKMLMEWQVTS